jgi:hypothetical protein
VALNWGSASSAGSIGKVPARRVTEQRLSALARFHRRGRRVSYQGSDAPDSMRPMIQLSGVQ